ncbi:putative ABC transport system ATP-binding protein [Pilibacter termitis]|uniref:Putative ABC transport system ATP-binding protein n=1 Tax=Pilibacter termitis TaxID=263852 RepID=A0A1T4PIP0_9ENTE|nr:ABC transporter ATP-binding protein [Pilibacter termitis]SJZ91369.1 putative ABC transport system ATP-binding protein [Pilibacter termitis]
MIELKRIQKLYKEKKVFLSTNFKAESGEIVVLTGKSGIGKTTLLDMIAGIKQFDEGEYFYQGQMILTKNDSQMSKFRNDKIGYILQDFALIDDYTVLENILLPSFYNEKMDKSQAENKAKSLAERFDLREILDKKVKNISGGQKQRVAIIRSLLLDPKIILADEPTTNLDADNFSFIVELFKKLSKQGKIVIIASHDERIWAIADRKYSVENYKLVEN